MVCKTPNCYLFSNTSCYREVSRRFQTRNHYWIIPLIYVSCNLNVSSIFIKLLPCFLKLVRVSAKLVGRTHQIENRDFLIKWTGRAYVTLHIPKHILRMRHNVDVHSLPRGRCQIDQFHVVLSGSECTSTSWRMRSACTQGAANFSMSQSTSSPHNQKVPTMAV